MIHLYTFYDTVSDKHSQMLTYRNEAEAHRAFYAELAGQQFPDDLALVYHGPIDLEDGDKVLGPKSENSAVSRMLDEPSNRVTPETLEGEMP